GGEPIQGYVPIFHCDPQNIPAPGQPLNVKLTFGDAIELPPGPLPQTQKVKVVVLWPPDLTPASGPPAAFADGTVSKDFDVTQTPTTFTFQTNPNITQPIPVSIVFCQHKDNPSVIDICRPPTPVVIGSS